MADTKNNYENESVVQTKNITTDLSKTMFTSYPDIVNISQMKNMLGIGVTLAYRLLKQNKIKCKKVGREYKIPKVNVIKYMMAEQ